MLRKHFLIFLISLNFCSLSSKPLNYFSIIIGEWKSNSKFPHNTQKWKLDKYGTDNVYMLFEKKGNSITALFSIDPESTRYQNLFFKCRKNICLLKEGRKITCKFKIKNPTKLIMLIPPKIPQPHRRNSQNMIDLIKPNAIFLKVIKKKL